MPIIYNCTHTLTVPVELNDGVKRVREPRPIGLADKGADVYEAKLTLAGAA